MFSRQSQKGGGNRLPLLGAEDLVELLRLHTAEQPDDVDGVVDHWQAKREAWGLDEEGLIDLARAHVCSYILPHAIELGASAQSLGVSSWLSGFDLGMIAAFELESRRVAKETA